ncbi:LytR/AlgR family response regulator transcription factor [Pedobacter roseus]|jgi:DNA-binding LytR/AlgR family response regulator|uniref:Response regulator transcription factor n=1 Tax=Pedobacter roseus TaxID=336820 RepID=A0A7G9QLC7_9SPHI|nr:LytTR family DNA-binding domain-containing protein [Pedobacter roseus]QNN44152.1 response regulator transcription factor [Pedobacter roseus]
MSISCIAIDDDHHALESLIEYVDKLPDLKLIQTFTEPLQALAEISASSPVDIIFMDVEMPSLSGIELAGLLRQKTKYLVFTTAHARYAIDAFKVEADAYLLKPYSILHFTKMINNLYPTGKDTTNVFSASDEYFFYIPLQGENGDLVRIDLNELIAVEELEEDIRFKTTQNTFFSSRSNFTKTLKMLKKHSAFIQISSTVVIAKQHIKSVLDNKILLSEETSFILSETHTEHFADFLKNNLPQEKSKPDPII